jgi:Putative DNA-binding domain
MPKLRDLQRGIRIAVLSGDAGAIRDAILSDGLSADARLQIHRNHVRTTLTEALKATFPVVCRLVDERFFAFAADTYIQGHPPSTPCLVEYGESFPGFLEAFPPCRSLPYLGDVARLEWTLNTALHAAEEPPALATALMQVRAADQPHLAFACNRPCACWLPPGRSIASGRPINLTPIPTRRSTSARAACSSRSGGEAIASPSDGWLPRPSPSARLSPVDKPWRALRRPHSPQTPASISLPRSPICSARAPSPAFPSSHP